MFIEIVNKELLFFLLNYACVYAYYSYLNIEKIEGAMKVKLKNKQLQVFLVLASFNNLK